MTEIIVGELHIEYNDEEIHAIYDLFYELFQRSQYRQDIFVQIFEIVTNTETNLDSLSYFFQFNYIFI